MKAIDVVEEIERVLAARGGAPGLAVTQSKVRRERTATQAHETLREIETLVEKFQMQGGRE